MEISLCKVYNNIRSDEKFQVTTYNMVNLR